MSEREHGSESGASKREPRRRRGWWRAGLLLLALGFFWVARDPAGERSVVALQDGTVFENRPSALLRSVPAFVQNPLRKLKVWLFGPPRLVTLEALVIRFPKPPALPHAAALEAGGKASAGARFLLVPATNGAAFKRQIQELQAGEILGAQTMHAYSGHAVQQATIANPLSNIYQGYTIKLVARVRGGKTDVALHAEALTPDATGANSPTTTRTNVLVSARAFLAPHTGMLALTGATDGGACTGIFVLPAIVHAKK